MQPFSGDGAVEVTAWLSRYERLCELEHIAPCVLIAYMLDGTAARVHGRMRVGEASQWNVVEAVLTADYAMPRQEAWHCFVSCRLEPGETVYVYLDRLDRLGGRLGVALEDMVFKTKFYEGLPESVYE